jgi:hypothetical protein
MKRILSIALLSMTPIATPLAAERAWSGTITDSMCGARHTMGEQGKNTSDRDCTQTCTSHGAQYALVSGGKVLKLRSHDADLKAHAGHVVTVTGEMSGDTIRVSKVEMP